MKHMKKVEVPSTINEIVDFVTCDLCGERIEKEIQDGIATYIDDVDICHAKGYKYPGWFNRKETRFDLCGECFDEKLIPWIESKGGHRREAEFGGKISYS